MSRFHSFPSQSSHISVGASDKRRHTSHNIPTNTNASHKSTSNERSSTMIKPLKSILSLKSSVSNNTMKSAKGSTTDSSDSISYRRTHFDKHNIDLTYKPTPREYGFMQITKADTPFPRKKSMVALGSTITVSPSKSKLFNEEKRRSIVVPLPKPFSSARFDGPLKMDFITKRKIFHKDEYTLTRQRRPMVVHPPLKSIQLNTQNSTSHVALTEFFRKHYRQRNESAISNFE